MNMAHASLKPCERCGALSKRRLCPAHRSPPRAGPAPWSWVYKDWRWRDPKNGTRAKVLRRDPTCTICTERPSTVGDHDPPLRTRLQPDGSLYPDPFDEHWCRGICASCSGRLTAYGRSQR